MNFFFDETRSRPARFYSRSGLVLTCSSFSKTAAPGYRVGWLLPGGFRETAYRLKRAYSASSSLLLQQALTEFLHYGEFDLHLKRLRKVLKTQLSRMTGLIAGSFPPETRISTPRGGCVLWLELPETLHSAALFGEALENGVSIAPGGIFSPSGKYGNFIRLSFGVAWSEEVEKSVNKLGQLVCRQA